MAIEITDDQINQIKTSLRNKFDKSVLQTARDNFYSMYEVLESKTDLDTWTEEDKQEVLSGFMQGCKDASDKTCIVVMREFLSFIDKYEGYEKYEYCKCCFFNKFCAGNPNNRDEDQWHYNLCLIWENIKKGPFDLDYIKDRWAKIKNSNDLEDLHNLVEDW